MQKKITSVRGQIFFALLILFTPQYIFFSLIHIPYLIVFVHSLVFEIQICTPSRLLVCHVFLYPISVASSSEVFLFLQYTLQFCSFSKHFLTCLPIWLQSRYSSFELQIKPIPCKLGQSREFNSSTACSSACILQSLFWLHFLVRHVHL